jgi:hypothetical protein
VALFPQSFIEDLRAQANILSVVQEYVPLKRAGRNYKGSARSIPRSRRHSRSTPRKVFSIASAARPAAMSSSSWNSTSVSVSRKP